MIHVKIYGQPTASYRYVKNMVFRHAREAGIQIEMEEINDIDSIITEELESIPTVRVNDHINLIYSQSETIEDYIEKLNNCILMEEKTNRRQMIWVPTDFSETSANASDFALALAGDMQANVTVVHSFIPRAHNMEGAVYIDPELEKRHREQLEQQVRSMNISLNDKPTEVREKFLTGFAGKEIPALADDPDRNIIVIGSTGTGGPMKNIFGSVSTMIARNARCPVFVIPPDVEYRSFGKIAYAADDKDLDMEVAGELTAYAQMFGSELHIVHIKDEEGEEAVERLENTCREISSDLFIKTHVVESDNIPEGLNGFVKEKDIDLLILTKKKRTFLDSLFHSSVTRRMTINTQIPLLILHR